MKSYVLMFDFEYIKIDRNAYRVGNDNETYNIITSNIKKSSFAFYFGHVIYTAELKRQAEDKVLQWELIKFFS